MKKVYYVVTNGYDMVVSCDQEGACRYMTENEYFPVLPDDPSEKQRQALDFLRTIEDDSSWEDDCEYNQIFVDDVEVLAEIESEI